VLAAHVCRNEQFCRLSTPTLCQKCSPVSQHVCTNAGERYEGTGEGGGHSRAGGPPVAVATRRRLSTVRRSHADVNVCAVPAQSATCVHTHDRQGDRMGL
jgi:hypothetical protein